eukprot:334944_1
MSNKEDKIHSGWDSTELFKDETNTSLNKQDIKLLLLNRANKKNLNGTKSNLMKDLKNNHTVTLSKQIKHLTMLEVQAELKLWGINHKYGTRDELIARLINKNNQWSTLNSPNVRIFNSAWNHKEYFKVMKINDNEFYAFFASNNRINRICKYNAEQNYWNSWWIDRIDYCDEYEYDVIIYKNLPDSVSCNHIDK